MIETLLFSAPANALTFFKFEMFLNSQLERVSGIELLFYAKQTMICQYHTLFKQKKKKKSRAISVLSPESLPLDNHANSKV